MRGIVKKIINGGLITSLVFSFLSAEVLAQGKDEPKGKTKITTSRKEIQGEVVSISKKYIAVVYARDSKKNEEYEILLPIDEDTKVERMNSLKDLKIGDTVDITFEEENVAVEKGEGKTSRKAKVVSFVAPALKGLVSEEE
jgi:ribosomal protein S17